VAAGGHIANVGVHGKPVQLNLDKLWAQNITLTTRLVEYRHNPHVVLFTVNRKLQGPAQLITHHLNAATRFMLAYDTCTPYTHLKIIITTTP